MFVFFILAYLQHVAKLKNFLNIQLTQESIEHDGRHDAILAAATRASTFIMCDRTWEGAEVTGGTM